MVERTKQPLSDHLAHLVIARRADVIVGLAGLDLGQHFVGVVERRDSNLDTELAFNDSTAADDTYSL